MIKYNFEFKKKVVLEYINENISIRSLAKKYAIKSHNNIEIWVAKYKKYGDEGLYRSRKNKEYTFEKKILILYISKKYNFYKILKRKIWKLVLFFQKNSKKRQIYYNISIVLRFGYRIVTHLAMTSKNDIIRVSSLSHLFLMKGGDNDDIHGHSRNIYTYSSSDWIHY